MAGGVGRGWAAVVAVAVAMAVAMALAAMLRGWWGYKGTVLDCTEVSPSSDGTGHSERTTVSTGIGSTRISSRGGGVAATSA